MAHSLLILNTEGYRSIELKRKSLSLWKTLFADHRGKTVEHRCLRNSLYLPTFIGQHQPRKVAFLKEILYLRWH
jgi:hypothetical protein